MLRKFSLLSTLVAFTAGMALSLKAPAPPVEKLFHTQLQAVIRELDAFRNAVREKAGPSQLKIHFARSRSAYKRSSVLVDYFFPGFVKVINPPDLKYAEDDNPDMIFEPHGFQVVERIVYTSKDGASYGLLDDELKRLTDAFISMNEQLALSYKFRNELVFDALRSGVIRLVSLGITGFDAPLSLNALEESVAVLTGMQEILSLYNEENSIRLISAAQKYISAAKSFNAFDRLTFIRDFGDPLYGSLVKEGTAAGYLLPEERRPVNQYSPSIFSEDFLDIDFFSPNQRYRLTPGRIALGRLLFYDSILSLSHNRSCASCHHPSRAFTDGLQTPTGIRDSARLTRNTPTLTGVAYQTRFFYDSRASTLENQLNSVVHNVDEMNGSLEEGIRRIRRHPQYLSLFREAYANDSEPVTEYNIANAISSYIRSLPVFHTRFDRYMRGEGQLSKREAEGFNLFAGKAKCATCHFIPLFNGLVPPQFTETESEVLGVPEKSGVRMQKLDEDLGKYLFTKSLVHKHAFKTPTLRNIALTAPYMHNGVYGTLEEVMEFYNKGGGAGIHTAPENQTLQADKLRLSRREIKSIIAFLGTLTEEEDH